MKLELVQPLIGDGATHPRGAIINVNDDFGQSLVARGIAIDAGLGAEIASIKAEAEKKLAEAKAKATEAEAARHAAAAKMEAEAKVRAEEARAKIDAPRRGSRVVAS